MCVFLVFINDIAVYHLFRLLTKVIRRRFEPGSSHVGRACGGMKAKASFDPPFIISDPEIKPIYETDKGKQIIGMLVVSDGVNAYKGARLNVKLLEKIVEGKISKLMQKIKENNSSSDKDGMISEIADSLTTDIVNQASSAQEKIGVSSYIHINACILYIAQTRHNI